MESTSAQTGDSLVNLVALAPPMLVKNQTGMISGNPMTLPREYLEVLKRERTMKGGEILRTTIF